MTGVNKSVTTTAIILSSSFISMKVEPLLTHTVVYTSYYLPISVPEEHKISIVEQYVERTQTLTE
jgi:hypothetical protein